MGDNVIDSNTRQSVLKIAVGECPEIDILIGEEPVRCLLDTGSQISTITESFFRKLVGKKSELIDVTKWMRVTGANELEVPYIGYVEVDIEIFDRKLSGIGVLVVKDPTNFNGIKRKERVPGLLGSNIFKSMKEMTETDNGGRSTMGKGTSDQPWMQILSLYEMSTTTKDDRLSFVKIPGKQPIKNLRSSS